MQTAAEFATNYRPSQPNSICNIWPVWRDSVKAAVKFTTISREHASKIWHKARKWEQRTHQKHRHGGIFGRTGLAVLYSLLHDFLNFKTGRLDPSVAAIARKSGACERTVHTVLNRLRTLGILNWQRRCAEDRDAGGRFHLRQLSNAYQLTPLKSWGNHIEAEPPVPTPDRLGFPQRYPTTIEAATQLIATGNHQAALQELTVDQTDPLALALAELGRLIDRS